MTAYDPLQTRLQAEPKIWLDTGTHDRLLAAGQFIATEIAWRNGFIDSQQLEKLAQPLARNGYGPVPAALAERGRSVMKKLIVHA